MNTKPDLARVVDEREGLVRSLFDTLAEKTHDGIGITRATFGEGEQFAHELVRSTAADLGLEIETDAGCNTYMTLPGRDRSLPKVMIGSHLDSVPQGGNFDGAAGVISGLAAVAALQAAGVRPEADITVMGIRAEESAWFGVSYIGSRMALGQLPAGALDDAARTDTGRSLADHIADAGGDPDRLRNGPPPLEVSRIKAFLEPHIEQGPVLETKGIPVGIVTGIRGNRRFPKARILGEYSHCGGVPRAWRKDAVIGFADLVMFLDSVWDEADGTDAGDFAFTIGRAGTDPSRHAMTTIAGRVDFSLDMRSLDDSYLDRILDRVLEKTSSIEAERRVRFELGQPTRAESGLMDQTIRAGMQDAAAELGIPVMDIASGAAHDSAAFAAAGVPTSMLFIRNRNGSHNPDEAMEISDFMAATRVMARWLSRNA